MTVDAAAVPSGIRNAALPDLAALLRDQQARKADIVAPAQAIRAAGARAREPRARSARLPSMFRRRAGSSPRPGPLSDSSRGPGLLSRSRVHVRPTVAVEGPMALRGHMSGQPGQAEIGARPGRSRPGSARSA
jgi:hypothetical protein